MSEQSEQDIATVAIAVEWYDTERTNLAFERLVTHIQELGQQRSAALKLADRMERANYSGIVDGFARELRACFKEK